MSNQAELTRKLFENSREQEFYHKMIREWELAYIEQLDKEDEGETCTCGQHPIKELCYIMNTRTTANLLLGNHCVNRIKPEWKVDSLHKAMKILRKCISRSIPYAEIDRAKSMGWINEWEYGFLYSTYSKNAMSDKQWAKRIAINKKLLEIYGKL